MARNVINLSSIEAKLLDDARRHSRNLDQAKKNNVASTTKAEREVKEALDELLVDRAEVNIYIEDPKDTKKEAKIALAECSLINAKACEAIVYENGKHWEKPYPWHYKSFPTRMVSFASEVASKLRPLIRITRMLFRPTRPLFRLTRKILISKIFKTWLAWKN